MTDDLRDLFDALSTAVGEELAGAVALRHVLHAHPNLSGDEVRTADRVVAALGPAEAEVVATTGRLIRIGSKGTGAGPVVAVRGELDALPVEEETGASFAATNGAMHACGHDVHLAALVALGRAARRVGTQVPLLAVLHSSRFLPPDEAVGRVARAMLAGFVATTAMVLATPPRRVGRGRR